MRNRQQNKQSAIHTSGLAVDHYRDQRTESCSAIYDNLEQYADPDTRVYFSWGTKEAHGIKDIWKEDNYSYTYHVNKEVADYIEKQNARVKVECQVGGGHCEADWELLVPSFMNFLWLEK